MVNVRIFTGYTGPDCSSCDPTFFSVESPDWGRAASTCELTDSKTSFIGVDPTPSSYSPSSTHTVGTLLEPKWLGLLVGGFLLILVIMVSVICYIRRGGRSRKVAEPVYPMTPGMVSRGGDDNESIASTPQAYLSTPKAYDSLHLASSGRTGKSFAPSDFRVPPRTYDNPPSNHNPGRNYDRDRSYTDRSYTRKTGQSSRKYSNSYEPSF